MNDYENNTNEQDVAEESSFPAAEELERETADEQRRVPVVGQLGIAFVFLFVALTASQASDLMEWFRGGEDQQAAVGDTTDEVPMDTDPFEDITVEAEAAYVWDVANQRALYNKHADTRWPLASVTKLMTALVAYELLGSDANVTVTADALRQAGDSGLLGDELFESGNLSDFTLLASSNDGAYALAAAGEAILAEAGKPQSFIDVMNIRADEIGLTQTEFSNPTGLDLSENEGGAYGSARDVAFLMEYLITEYPGVLEMTRTDTAFIPNTYGQTHEAANTNAVSTKIPGLLGSKTGYTTLAGGNLVVAFDAGLNRPIIVSVLGSSSLGRFTDTLKLVEAAQAKN